MNEPATVGHADACQCVNCQIVRAAAWPTDGGPAFPQTVVSMQAAPNMSSTDYSYSPAVASPFTHSWTGGGGGVSTFPAATGMSLLDYFAGQAMMSLAGAFNFSLDSNRDLAARSYEIAAAMLEARKR